MGQKRSDNDHRDFVSQIYGDSADDDPRWTSIDANWYMVLHLAAVSIKADSVQWITSEAKALPQ